MLTIRPAFWRRLLRVATTIVPACGLSFSVSGQTKPGTVRFDQQVRPILDSRCSMCHSQEKRSGGLSLATYSDALEGGRSGFTIRPGNSSGSLLVQRITGQTQPRMPLGGKPLSDEEVATIRTWIDEGARPTPDAPPAKPKWEAPLALKMPEVPASPWRSWSAPVDRLVASYLVRNGVTTPTIVSDGQFARRAYLDIWGLLPPPEELKAFIKDESPRKRERLVQRLLAGNTRYAEHWITFWNDLLRNDEGVNYYSETASRKSITAWLVRSLESNLAYDQFVKDLINPASAGDPDGFLIGVNWRGTVSASQTPALQAAQNTAQIFLGINLKCNSCHDSFISKWKLKDAYSLAGYFSPEEKLELYRCDVAQHKFATPGFLYPELDRPVPSNSLADRHATAAAIFTDARDGRLSRTLVNRFWERLLGRGLVENVDEMDGEPWAPELLDWLSADFVAHGYDMKHLIATIIGSQAYQLASIERKGEQPKKYVFGGPEVRRLTAEQFSDAVASITGEWHVAPPSGDAPSRNRAVPASSVASARVKTVFPGGAVLAPASLRAGNAARSNAAPDLDESAAGTYSREWRIAASSLTRALGRPIRDQVFSTRDNQATTIQAVELMNGETLTHWLNRGARRMLGELPPEPRSLFAAQVNRGRDLVVAAPDSFDIDISKSSTLFLIVQDALSTAPDKALPLWLDAELESPAGKVSLSSLKPAEASGMREGIGPVTIAGMQSAGEHGAVRVKLASVLKYDIARKGFTRFRGAPGFETMKLAQGESVRTRFFVFDREPNLDRLVQPIPGTPLPQGPVLRTARAVTDRVFNYALGRDPSPAERRIAEVALRSESPGGDPSADGLADLLWAVLMKPEFQLIY